MPGTISNKHNSENTLDYYEWTILLDCDFYRLIIKRLRRKTTIFKRLD